MTFAMLLEAKMLLGHADPSRYFWQRRNLRCLLGRTRSINILLAAAKSSMSAETRKSVLTPLATVKSFIGTGTLVWLRPDDPDPGRADRKDYFPFKNPFKRHSISRFHVGASFREPAAALRAAEMRD